MSAVLERGPRFAVLSVPGSNCDLDMKNAFNAASGRAEIVRVKDFREGRVKLSDFQGLGLPGGFGYSDAIRSGIIQANELVNFMADEINDFIAHGGVALGVCNGFQELLGMGLLPGGKVDGNITAALTFNQSGHFECSWRDLKVEQASKCQFLDGLPDVMSFQVAHGEGRFEVSPKVLAQIESRGQVALRYAPGENPNGSLNDIAGITDPTGRILGMMPHPERFIRRLQHPNARMSDGFKEPHGLIIFNNIVKHAA